MEEAVFDELALVSDELGLCENYFDWKRICHSHAI